MKTKLVVIMIVLSWFLLGCQGTTSTITTETTPRTNGSFKVAILLPRPKDADGWTRAGYAGLQVIKKELRVDIAYSENVPEADFEKVFRYYATEGYDFIIGHGNQFVPAAEKVAAEFPRTNFAVSGKYGGNNTNLGGLSLREGEVAYLFGAIAAMKTKTKHVACLGGSENMSQQEIKSLFKRGAEATDSTIQVRIDFVGNFTDTARAQQLAQSQIDSGVDVIFVLAGMAGTDVHAQAEQAGIFTLGWIEDLNHLAPKAVLTSNVQDLPVMLLRGATLAKQGRWEGKQYKFGLADGAQYLAPFYGLLSADEEKQINAVKNGILTGEIDTTPE